METQLCNFADDNIAYGCGASIDIVATKWVIDSHTKIAFLGIKGKHNLCLGIEGSHVKSSKEVKLLGVIIDSKLNFISHVKTLCKKANHKISALSRVRNYLSPVMSRLLYNAYILSTFICCPLIWTFANKTTNICMQKLKNES